MMRGRVTFAVLDWIFFIVELLESVTERYTKEVVDIIHRINLGIEKVKII